MGGGVRGGWVGARGLARLGWSLGDLKVNSDPRDRLTLRHEHKSHTHTHTHTHTSVSK